MACRGVVRQLGRPALLAASYSGDGPGAATAALEEVEAALAAALYELERGGTAATGAPLENACIHLAFSLQCTFQINHFIYSR